jgi:hypothetical protein
MDEPLVIVAERLAILAGRSATMNQRLATMDERSTTMDGRSASVARFVGTHGAGLLIPERCAERDRPPRNRGLASSGGVF